MIKISEQLNHLFLNLAVTRGGIQLGVGITLAWKQAVIQHVID